MYLSSVNTSHGAFDAIGQIVKRVQSLVEEKNDQHERNSLLVGYIQYTGTLPHPPNAPHSQY